MVQPAKRQRVYRKRADSDSEGRGEEPDEEQPRAGSLGQGENGTDEDQSVASLLRWRKLQKRSRTGLAFNKGSLSTSHIRENAESFSEDAQAASAPAMIANEGRFARETGLRLDNGTDKHMMAYIDSKLAQLRKDEGGSTISPPPVPLSSAHKTAHGSKQMSSGKLQEIDLGPSATELNIQRTEQARQRLEGNGVDEAEPSKPQRIRLGRDGKPMRPRKRFRRRSEDVERDKLIDSLMKEARLEVYERPDEVPNGTGEDEAADERVAEEFRREFLNQVEDRNVRRGPPPPPGPARGAKGEPDITKGPKLGGSRSARAAMRAKQEAAKKQ